MQGQTRDSDCISIVYIVEWKDTFTYLSSFAVSTQEMQWQRTTQIKIQSFEHDAFHLADGSFVVGVIRDVHKIIYLPGYRSVSESNS